MAISQPERRRRDRIRKRRWAKQNPGDKSAANRRYYLAHREEILEKARQRRETVAAAVDGTGAAGPEN